MSKPARDLVFKALLWVLRPAVSFCLRHSLRLQDLIECAKAAFVEAGRAELESAGQKANVSRLAAMSGVHRRDVQRILKLGPADGYEKDLITKVMGAWQTKAAFTAANGKPRVLTLSGDDSEFPRLVREVSADLNPGTVLFELARVGAVEVGPRGAKLVVESYVPKGDPEAGFKIYAADSSDLCLAVEENVLTEQDLPQFQARTAYDKIRLDEVDGLKKWFLKEGHEFHARVREKLGAADQDINPDPKWKGGYAKVSFGSYSFVKKERKK